MNDTKFPVELTIDDWSRVLNGLNASKNELSKLGEDIANEVNRQVASMQQAQTPKVEEDNSTETNTQTEDVLADVGSTVGVEEEDVKRTNSDTVGKEAEEKEKEVNNG